MWVSRCRTQIGDALAKLEEARAAVTSAYWFGAAIGHADIAVTTALRFIGDAHKDLIPLDRCPTLMRHAERMEAMREFKEISQAFIPPS